MHSFIISHVRINSRHLDVHKIGFKMFEAIFKYHKTKSFLEGNPVRALDYPLKSLNFQCIYLADAWPIYEGYSRCSLLLDTGCPVSFSAKDTDAYSIHCLWCCRKLKKIPSLSLEGKKERKKPGTNRDK